MRFHFGLAFAALMVMGATPAFAQANCEAPIPPAAPDGKTATQAQITAAVTDAKNCISQSDV